MKTHFYLWQTEAKNYSYSCVEEVLSIFCCMLNLYSGKLNFLGKTCEKQHLKTKYSHTVYKECTRKIEKYFDRGG